ncbi:3'-5' exonuclease [Eubacterium oxidoreducens]|uniref:DNA polymerase III, epsilon subunit n=1 Tax=Eubacterium oxidoreducens TaxID=1732 RepID=A0A1G6A404_EUBOX|nr:3'-5' exonuclease [Eubacterium oxidoreducens]SDB03115.1 DNA polymerase III, epsilon subunit [Eubacterium oxidoreducens]
MKHIVVDLEMNTIRKKDDARRICGLETIEIGAVMLNDNLQEISSFRTYVKPEHCDGIARNISRLTGITDDMVANAPKFNEALHMFANWCLATGDEVIVYAWSESDYSQIAKEMVLKSYEISGAETELLGNDWFDFQQEFDSYLGFERQVSLKMALEMAGVDFLGREHDALDDARNTAELLQIIRDEERFNKTLRKIKEYMEPTEIGTTIGSLIDFSAFVCA